MQHGLCAIGGIAIASCLAHAAPASDRAINTNDVPARFRVSQGAPCLDDRWNLLPDQILGLVKDEHRERVVANLPASEPNSIAVVATEDTSTFADLVGLARRVDLSSFVLVGLVNRLPTP